MRSKLREPFLVIPDRLITEGEESHLTEIELYLYSLLLKKRNYEGVTETCISFIEETCPIEMGSSRQRSIELIKKTLLSLADKKVLKICSAKGEILNEFKPSELIVIIFGKSRIKGHTEVDYKKVDSFTSLSDYYVYVVVARFKNSGNGSFNCSYCRWAKILRVSEKTAKTKVNKAVEKEIIYKNIGNYRDDDSLGGAQKKQEKNSYRITPYKKHEKTIMTNRNELITSTENVANLF